MGDAAREPGTLSLRAREFTGRKWMRSGANAAPRNLVGCAPPYSASDAFTLSTLCAPVGEKDSR